MLSSILAIGWEPELRGVLVFIISVAVLCGSVYLILGTNLGARLGFLVALAGLFGWMATMGALWWVYGIGLKGREPAWEPANDPVTIVNDADLFRAGIVDEPNETTVVGVEEVLLAEGWIKLPEADPGRGQAATAADEILVNETERFDDGGQYELLAVYDLGGERSPVLFDGKLDFLAFWHKPHYAMVAVAPTVEQRVEPGRAPPAPIIDTAQKPVYVMLLKDLGSKRQPAAFITIGSGLIFLVLCWLLHRRDRYVIDNRSAPVEAPIEKAPVSAGV